MYHYQNIPHEDPQKSSNNINNTNTYAYSNTLTKYSQKYIVPAQVSFNELSPSNEFNLHKKNANSISQDQSSYFLHDRFFNKQNQKEHDEQFRDKDQDQENTLARLLMFDSDDFGTVENGPRNGISRQQQSPLSINASLDNNKTNISNPIKYVNSRYETYPDPEYENDAFNKVKKQQNNISSNNVVEHYKPLTNPNLVNYTALPLYESQYQFNRLPLSSVQSLQQQPVKIYEQTSPKEGNFKKKHYFQQQKQEDFYHGIQNEDQRYETEQSQDQLFKFIIKLLEILNKKIKTVVNDSFQSILRNGPITKIFKNKNFQLHSRKEDQIINKYIKLSDAQLKYSIAKDIENPNIPFIHPQSISSFQIQGSQSSSSLPYTISTSINEPIESSKRKQIFTIQKNIDEAESKFSSTHPANSKLVSNQEELPRHTINAYPYNNYGVHHKNQAIFQTFNKIVQQSQQQSNANTNSNIGSFHSGIPQFQFNSKLKAKTKSKKKSGVQQNDQIKIKAVDSMQIKSRQKPVNQFPKFERQSPIIFQRNPTIISFKNLIPLAPDDSIKNEIQDQQIESQQSCHVSYGFIDSQNLCSNSNDDFIDGSEQEVLPVYQPQHADQSQNIKEIEQSCNLYVDSNTKKNGTSQISSQALKNSVPLQPSPVTYQQPAQVDIKIQNKKHIQKNPNQNVFIQEQENQKFHLQKNFGSDINSDKQIITSSIQEQKYIQQQKSREGNVQIKNAVSFIHIRPNQIMGNANYIQQSPTIIIKNPHIHVPASPTSRQQGITVRFTSTSPIRNKERVASAYVSPPRDINNFPPKIILEYNNNQSNLRRDQQIIIRPYSQPNLRSIVSMKKNIEENFYHPRIVDPNKKVIQVRSNYYGPEQRIALPANISPSSKPQFFNNRGQQKIIHSDKNMPIRPKSPSYQHNHQNIVSQHYQIIPVPGYQQITPKLVSPQGGSNKYIIGNNNPYQQIGHIQNSKLPSQEKNTIKQMKGEKKGQNIIKKNFNKREQQYLDQTFISKLNTIEDHEKHKKIKQNNNIIKEQKSPSRYSPYMDTHVIAAKDKPNFDDRNIQVVPKQTKQIGYKPPFGFASPNTNKSPNIMQNSAKLVAKNEQKISNTPIRYQNSLSPQNKPFLQQTGERKANENNKANNPLYESYHDYDYLYSIPHKGGSRKKLNLVSKEEEIRKSQYKNY